TTKHTGQTVEYQAKHLVIATGYYDEPQYLGVPGEQLSKVTHYFKEAHPYYNQDVVVIGGKSADVDATWGRHTAGANVAVCFRGATAPDTEDAWDYPNADAPRADAH